MYLVSQDFIDDAKKLGRVLDIRLTFDGEVISGGKVTSLEKDFEATLLATASQQITGEIVGRYDLTDSVIRVEIGIGYELSPFSYVDYGFFIVKEHKRIVGAKGSQDKTTFVAYDIMLNAHELYDVDKLGVNYPISVFNLYKAIATYIGTEVSETSVINGNMMIEEDKYTNIENVTYRNVLDDLSATMGASIIVSKNKLLAKYVDAGMVGSTNVDSLHENNMRSLSIKDKMKPINILNLTREDAHDNYPYPLNWETIPVNDRSEIVIPDNQIMDKRRDEYAPSLFNAIEGLSYTPFDSETYGVLYLEPLDTIEVVDMNEVSHVSLVTSNRLKFTSGIKESLTSELPSKLKEKYALVTDNERQSMRVYFLVDKQNGIIQGLVEELGGVQDRAAQLTIKVDSIETQVSSINNNANIIPNFNGNLGIEIDSGGQPYYPYWIFLQDGLIPATDLYPSQLPQSKGSPIFWQELVSGSLSKWGLRFDTKGRAITGAGYVVPTETYSFRGKRHTGVQRFKIYIREYTVLNSKYNENFTEKLILDASSPNLYEQVSVSLKPDAVEVRLVFETLDNNTLVLTEMMFNRGVAKPYSESVGDAILFAESTRVQLSDRITDTVTKIEIVDGKTVSNKSVIDQLSNKIVLGVDSNGKIVQVELGVNPDDGSYFVVKAENISLEGVTTINGNFKVLANGDVEFNNAKGTNMDITGKVTATSGAIGGWSVDSSKLMSSNTMTGMSSGTWPTDPAFWAGGTNPWTTTNWASTTPFYVRNNGELVANNATIRGNITAEDGNIGGFTIYNDRLSFASDTHNFRFALGGVSQVGNILPLWLGQQSTHQPLFYITSQGDIYSTGDIHSTGDFLHKVSVKVSGYSRDVVVSLANDEAGIRAYELIPRGSSGGTIGRSSGRYGTIFLTSQPNVSSDARYKSSIQDIDPLLLEIIHEEVKPKTYNTIYDDKNHFGYIAQDVERALYKYCLQKYGRERANEEVKMFAMLSKDESYMSLLYGEIAVLMDAYNRMKNNELEDRISKLERLINNGI